MTRLFLLLLSLAAITSPACAQVMTQTPGDPTLRETVIEYGGPDAIVIETEEGPVTLNVELAETPEQRQRGLMWREEMAEDAGMLFDFQEARIVSIWMENTLIPLDIAYIRPDGTIAKVIAHAEPLSRRPLYSGEPVVGVLEINAGRAAELGIDPGDLVRHAMFGTAGPQAPETLQAPEAAAETAPGLVPATQDGQGGDEAQPQEG